MAGNILELFGYSPDDQTQEASGARSKMFCPFLESSCTKQLRDGAISGMCSFKPATSSPVICCPNRLYADDYRVLRDVASTAFGSRIRLISGEKSAKVRHDGHNVAVFGKRWGKELRLPQRGHRGGYFVDWILALLDQEGKLKEFVAVEIQSIDTTGNYRAERESYLKNQIFQGMSKAGLNWENVSKRILPQLIYKGHVLRREPMCRQGMFLVCPTAVYDRILQRLGGKLLKYGRQPGSLTFRWYGLGEMQQLGTCRPLQTGGEFTTTIDQIAVAFTSPTNLPPEGVYEAAIREEL
ncbi:MAG TPA: NotI family restriction endonuclease [Acidobacteriota bacterium]|nr:NotI family restriction endonuclease [Acidobacteriota bacterium]